MKLCGHPSVIRLTVSSPIQVRVTRFPASPRPSPTAAHLGAERFQAWPGGQGRLHGGEGLSRLLKKKRLLGRVPLSQLGECCTPEGGTAPKRRGSPGDRRGIDLPRLLHTGGGLRATRKHSPAVLRPESKADVLERPCSPQRLWGRVLPPSDGAGHSVACGHMSPTCLRLHTDLPLGILV